MSTRRRFLVGLGRFTGAVLIVPDRTIFDMGRGLATLPVPSPIAGFGTAVPYTLDGTMDCESVANWMLRQFNSNAGVDSDGYYPEVLRASVMVDRSARLIYRRWRWGGYAPGLDRADAICLG